MRPADSGYCRKFARRALKKLRISGRHEKPVRTQKPWPQSASSKRRHPFDRGRTR